MNKTILTVSALYLLSVWSTIDSLGQTLTLASEASLVLHDATLTLDGGTFVNQGELHISGLAKIWGSLTTTGSLTFTLRNSTIPVHGHDQLIISEDATLGGSIIVLTHQAYQPYRGDEFELITCGSACSDTFDTVTPSEDFQIVYLPSRVLAQHISPYSWEVLGDSLKGWSWPSFAINPADDVPHIVYTRTEYPQRAVVHQYENDSWTPVDPPVSDAGEIPVINRIAFNSLGVPYVAFTDEQQTPIIVGAQLTVRRFTGTSWVNAGSERFSDGSALSTTLAFNRQNTAYVAYEDQNGIDPASNRPTVKQFLGSNWLTVGEERFGNGGLARGIDLAFDSLNTPYISYGDSDQKQLVIKRFNGNNWIDVGPIGFSGELRSINYSSMAFDSQNTLYVAYISREDGITVRKFNGVSWEPIGSRNLGLWDHGQWLPSSKSDQPRLHIDSEDNIYISAQGVYMFDGSDWVAVGKGPSDCISFAIDSNDVLYCLRSRLLRFDTALLDTLSAKHALSDVANVEAPNDIDRVMETVPEHFRLEQNYPNPFNPITTVRFSVPETSVVSLKVYNAMGAEVATLADNTYGPGWHSVTWDATSFASGVYLYQLQAGSFISTQKLILMK